MALGITDQELSDRIATGMRIGGNPDDASSGRDLTSAEKKDMDTLMKLLSKFQEFTDNPESDSSVVNLFRLLGGDPIASSGETPRTVTLPWWGHALRPMAAVRDIITGTDNTLGEGQLALMRKMKNHHVDIPRNISFGPPVVSTYIEDIVKKYGRKFLLGLDALPILHPITRIRQLRSFFSHNDAKFEKLDMATQLNVQSYTHQATDLTKNIANILLAHTPEFASAAVYHMHANGLHSCQGITEVSEASKRKMQKAELAGESIILPEESIINKQKFDAVAASAKTIAARWSQGDSNRLGFLASDLQDVCYLPNMQLHYEHTLKSVILSDELRNNHLKTARVTGCGGIPKYTMMMKHIFCNVSFLAEYSEARRNGFATDADDASAVYEYAVRRRDDEALTPFQRSMDQVGTFLEGREWSGKQQRYHPLGFVRSFFLRLFGVNMHTKQKRATSFFVNTGWETFDQIQKAFDTWHETKNDCIADIQGLAYWMKQIPFLLTSFTKHAGAFSHGVGKNGTRGELPPSIAKRFGLANGATGSDLINFVINKWHPMAYEVLRSANTMLHNVESFDPSWKSSTDGQPFGYRVILSDGTIDWRFEAYGTRTKEEREAEYKTLKSAYSDHVNSVMRDIYAAARTTSGYLNSTSSTYRGVADEMAKVEAANTILPLPKNFAGRQVRQTPVYRASMGLDLKTDENDITRGRRAQPPYGLSPQHLDSEFVPLNVFLQNLHANQQLTH